MLLYVLMDFINIYISDDFEFFINCPVSLQTKTVIIWFEAFSSTRDNYFVLVVLH